MLTVYKCFDEESDKREFVYESEDRFEADLDRVAREVRDDKGLKVVTLSGPLLFRQDHDRLDADPGLEPRGSARASDFHRRFFSAAAPT